MQVIVFFLQGEDINNRCIKNNWLVVILGSHSVLLGRNEVRDYLSLLILCIFRPTILVGEQNFACWHALCTKHVLLCTHVFIDMGFCRGGGGGG
jgi:hypothetical protein